MNPGLLRGFERYVKSMLTVSSLSAISETCNLLTLANRLSGRDGPLSGFGMAISSIQRKRARLNATSTTLSLFSFKTPTHNNKIKKNNQTNTPVHE